MENQVNSEVAVAEPSAPARPETPKFKAPRKKRKWVKRVIALAVVVAVGVFVFRSCSGGAKLAAAGNYLTEQAEMQDLTVEVSGTGTIEPINSYKVTTLIRGEVLEAPFEEGQTVRKGDLLFRIDSKDVETGIQQARLALEQAQLTYDNLSKSAKDAKLTANASGVISRLYVDQGDNVMAGAQVADILDRSTMKLKVPFHASDAAGLSLGQTASVVVDGTVQTIQGTVSEISALDEVGAGGTLIRTVTVSVANPGVITDQSTGTAAVGTIACAASGPFTYAAQKTVVAKTSGELAVLSVKEGDTVSEGQVIGSFDADSITTQIENARISVENARLTLQKAQDSLEDYSITSTIDGTVIEKNVDVGDNIDGTSTTTAASGVSYPAVIYDLSALTFDMSIDELDINKVKVGQTVEITVDALDGRTYTGTVDKVNINGTTAGGKTTYPVTVLVDGAPEELYPGMNVSARIIVERVGKVLCVPVEAVSREDGGSVLVPGADAVYDDNGNMLSPGTPEKRQVTLGRNNETYIEIVDGLSEGETVLVSNQSTNMMQMMMGG
ncbi:HlyD family efflux transporter periplasmic adaptor subunit [Pseudoflavonifractor sp. HCP28S3_F10]|uniref:HlyD family efflux transporter periplasmic adaptor subunit n=1 Tax=Pseudoflavonifractor sp. HCP28S3_F10 TaxID=3438947 RepID=UPI003F8A48F6